jgi:hypothetical protein
MPHSRGRGSPSVHHMGAMPGLTASSRARSTSGRREAGLCLQFTAPLRRRFSHSAREQDPGHSSAQRCVSLP